MGNKRTPEIRFQGFTGDWEQRKVKDFSEETFGGGTPKTSIKEYWSGEIPWIQSSDLQEHQVSGVFAKKKINEKGLQNSATKLIPKNSIAIVTRVGVGKIALIQFEYATSQDFLSLSNLKVNEWFGVYSLYNQLQKELHNVQGTSIKGITKNELLDKGINIPTNSEEQTKIGSFFKQLDDTIALHQQELTILKQTKQGFLQKMFPKEGESVPEVRFPGFTGEWEERKVKDFSEETFGGGTPKTSIKEYWNGEIPWIQSSDLEEHQVSGIFARKKITEKGLRNSATKLIPKNSIAIVTRVGVGKIALIQFEYATSQDFLSLSNLKVNEWFGVYSLYNQLQKELHNVQGTSIKGITKNELLEKKINIPTDLKEQTKIGVFFKKLDNTIALHQRELDALKETKKAFLQKMFV
ncbi:restriction endonuclease subunit S [Bacillus spizizenii]|uniref:restriction endonuclease subunit S n=1 Tax=Bacillus spizizenii TaxID=96241 RepID=UPI0005F0C0E2|nr:restriction endonuclease subunit S [Bacillus spizizenii]MCY7810626.1 restriction endonuclease subunit S [Bacillus spizizenii]MCY7868848.1 restriction endonuclease subunit S [Bacillus spizizenii]MCY7882517.1 restriction endonuclease subunit S [Bacillus spizizenii]MCY7889305.1 restriction endonuclease subunit S [Bacillus spizizenii]MCY7922452.1 restriction endonuclease subunit S [Bacillus spizizenii]